jgi:hypothetical protein
MLVENDFISKNKFVLKNSLRFEKVNFYQLLLAAHLGIGSFVHLYSSIG